MSSTIADDLQEESAKMALLAFVLPFVIFWLSGYVESQFRDSVLFYWIYTARILAVFACLYWGRRHFPNFSFDGIRWGVAAGILGFGLWILLTRLSVLEFFESTFNSVEVFGISFGAFFNNERPRWNAWVKISKNPILISFLIVRLIGLAIVLPMMEEVFWRGFFMRYIIDAEFRKVPIGKVTPFAFCVVTVLFVLVHNEVLAALVWGIMINVLYWKTKNLWACVTMHVVTNFLLGIYILVFDAWELW